MYVQKFPRIDDAALGEIEQVYGTLVSQLQSGSLTQELANITPDEIQNIHSTVDAGPFQGSPTEQEEAMSSSLHQCLLRVLTAEGRFNGAEGGDSEVLVARCLQADDEQQKN